MTSFCYLFWILYQTFHSRLTNAIITVVFIIYISTYCRCQWPRGLRRRSAAVRLLRSWVRIPPGAWIFVWCECCVLSGRGLCEELITRPEESYRLWCVVVCDLETSRMRRPWPVLGRSATAKKNPLIKTRWYNTFEFSVLDICEIFYEIILQHSSRWQNLSQNIWDELHIPLSGFKYVVSNAFGKLILVY